MVVGAWFISAMIIPYLLMCVVEPVATVWVLRRGAPSQKPLRDIYLKGQSDGSKAADYLVVPSAAMAWPVTEATELRRRQYSTRSSDLHFRSAVALRPRVILVSGAGIVVAVVIFLLSRGPGFVWFPALFGLWLLSVVAIVAKHCHYVNKPLNESLRRTLSSPFAIFAAVALMDAATLSLLVAAGRSQLGRVGAPSLEDVWSAAIDLFNLPGNLAELAELDLQDAGVAVMGLLYSVALVRSLLKPKEFSRTDDDWVITAGLLINLGDRQRARDYLNRVSSRNYNTWLQRARLHLLDGDVDAAAGDMGRAIRTTGDDAEPQAIAIMLVALSTSTDLDVSTRCKLICHLANLEVNDAVVASAIVANLAEVDDIEAVAQEIAACLPEASFPLSHWRLDANQLTIEKITALASSRLDDPVDEMFRVNLILGGFLYVKELTWPRTLEEMGATSDEYPLEQLEQLVGATPSTLKDFVAASLVETGSYLKQAVRETEGLVEYSELAGKVQAYAEGVTAIAEPLFSSSRVSQRASRITGEAARLVYPS